MTGPAIEGEVVDAGGATPAGVVVPGHAAPPVARLFAAGWCRRCDAPYVAVDLAEANGACSRRCTRALRQLDASTSRGRARLRQHERKAAERQEWIAANVGQPCPECGKRIHTEESAANAAAAIDRRAGVRIGTYPCPTGSGLHLTNLAKRNAGKKVRWRVARRQERPTP